MFAQIDKNLENLFPEFDHIPMNLKCENHSQLENYSSMHLLKLRLLFIDRIVKSVVVEKQFKQSGK